MSNVSITGGTSAQPPGGPVLTDGETVLGNGQYGNAIRLPSGGLAANIVYATSTIAHATTIGNAVQVQTESDTLLGVKRASANSFTGAPVAGILIPNTFGQPGAAIQTSGIVTLTTAQWDAVVTGESGGLTANDVYYLSDVTAGLLTTTPPTASGSYVTPIGRALSATQLQLELGLPRSAVALLPALGATAATLAGQPLIVATALNDYALGRANSEPNSRLVGINIPSTDPSALSGFAVQRDGVVTLTAAQWDAVVPGESGGLTRGAKYYLLDTTAGELTTAAPANTGSYIVAVGIALSATQLDLQIGQPVGPHA